MRYRDTVDVFWAPPSAVMLACKAGSNIPNGDMWRPGCPDGFYKLGSGQAHLSFGHCSASFLLRIYGLYILVYLCSIYPNYPL